MRNVLFITIALYMFLLVGGYQAQTLESHDETNLDMEINQPTRTPGMPTPTTTPTRTPTPATPTTTPRTGRPRPRPRPRLTPIRSPRGPLRDMMPGMGIRGDMSGWMVREGRMLMRMFRALLEMRMRAMFGIPRDVPLSRWERRMIRMMALRDMMMMMDVQADEAAELSSMMDEQETGMDSNEPETTDSTSTATEHHSESETETEIEAEPEVEHEIEAEAIPEQHEENAMMEEDVDDPTLIEAEFDIQAPYGYGGHGGYGGYGGYGKKGGYGGYGGYGKKGGFGFGGKKGGFGFGFGGKKGGFGFGFGFGGKKAPPFKKVPFKKVPIKKGGYGGF